MEFGEMGFAMHLLREGDVFVDVGANVGVYSIMAAARGAKVLAIEPVSTTYQQLMDNVYLNRFGTRVTTFNVGVGGDNGELGFSSQCGPMNHVIRPGETEEVGERVTVRPLDEIVNDEPVLIKIDVEGFESEVIRGGEEVLRRGSLRAVIIELNGLGARYAYSDDDIHSRLLSFGFQAARYEPFSRRLTPREGHNTSGNTLYVRSAHEVERRLREARPIRWGKFQI
jgi:FkbM family methyltransferase